MRYAKKLFAIAGSIACLTLPATASQLLNGVGSNGGGGVNQVQLLVNSMPHNSWKLVSTGTDGGFAAAMIPHTLTNFSIDAWATNLALQAGGPSGIGASNGPPGGAWAFSAPDINPVTGKGVMFGGGHSDSGDGTVYSIDLAAGAALINSSTGAASWIALVPGTRWRLGSDPIPSNNFEGTDSTKTATFGASSTTVTLNAASNGGNISISDGGVHFAAGTIITAGAGTTSLTITPATLSAGTNIAVRLGPRYLSDTNVNGTAMPPAVHSYKALHYFPGTNIFTLGGFGPFNDNSGPCFGAGYTVNDTTGAVVGPLVYSGTEPVQFTGNCLGYSGQDNGLEGIAIDDLSGNIFTMHKNTFSFDLFKWTNPQNSSLTPIVVTDQTEQVVDACCSDAVIFPDPAAPTTQRAFFQHITNTGTNEFLLVQNIDGTAGAQKVLLHQYSGTLPVALAVGNTEVALTYDSLRGTIAMVNGCSQHIFEITPSATLTAWTVSDISAASTGAVPAFGPSSSSVPGFEYLAAWDIYGLICDGQYWIYRP